MGHTRQLAGSYKSAEIDCVINSRRSVYNAVVFCRFVAPQESATSREPR